MLFVVNHWTENEDRNEAVFSLELLLDDDGGLPNRLDIQYSKVVSKLKKKCCSDDELPKNPGHFVASRPEMLQDLAQRLAEDYPIQGI